MRHKLIYILLLPAFFFLVTSCNDEKEIATSLQGMDFGESVYFNPFLWVKSDTTILNKKLQFEFNNYAIENDAFLQLQFTDNEGVKIDNNLVNVYIDGRLIQNGLIRVNADSEKVLKEIGIQFLPNLEAGDYHGYLVVVTHNFDRIDNFKISQLNNDNRIKQWSAYYEKEWNPLALLLFWLFLIAVTALLLWFIVFRNKVYPKIRGGKLIINSPYYKIIKLKGSRKLALTTERQRQKRLQKLFAGRIDYEVNPLWEPEIVLYPHRRKTLRIKLGLGYTITPFTTVLQQGSSYELKKQNVIIRISYL